MQIDCSVQCYAWGKVGRTSEVATLKSASDDSFALKEDSPYAELWMGTHPSGPSRMKVGGRLLKDFLNDHPGAVGHVPEGYEGNDLPFLFKVLSVATALSIQAHPDKTLAKLLHERSPENYKDPNHKPEMAIALTTFEALSGFRSISEIIHNLEAYPEVKTMVGEAAISRLQEANEAVDVEVQRAAIRVFFCAFMEQSEQVVNELLQNLVQRIATSTSAAPLEKLMLRLHRDYPGDRGVVVPLFLNYITLSAGEGFFMGPNEPHAYLSGDCVECMALSDNVVRAGLTPKFRDVETLCSMLHYRCGVPSLIVPTIVDEFTMRYRPPVDVCAEFEVDATVIPTQTHSLVYSLPVVPAGSIILVFRCSEGDSYSGSSSSSSSQEQSVPLKNGMVLFQGAGETIQLQLQANSSGITLYRAHTNLDGIV